MRQYARSHRAATSAVLGVVFGLILFVVGGGFSGGPVNLVLAVLVGCVFGVAAFLAPRIGPPSKP
jgi:hypothetical protein